MRIRAIGIDPGFRNTGIAVVELDGDALQCLAVKYVETPPEPKRRAHLIRTNADDLARMQQLHAAVVAAIARSGPHCMGIETYKVAGARGAGGRKAAVAGGNAWKTTIAYGVACAAGYAAGLTIYAHDPVELKAAVAGYVQADKKAVEAAILKIVPGVADAVARAGVTASNREHVFDAVGHALLALRVHRSLAVEVR